MLPYDANLAALHARRETKNQRDARTVTDYAVTSRFEEEGSMTEARTTSGTEEAAGQQAEDVASPPTLGALALRRAKHQPEETSDAG